MFPHPVHLSFPTLFPDRFYILVGMHRCEMTSQLAVLVATCLGSGITMATDLSPSIIGVEKLSSSVGDKVGMCVGSQDYKPIRVHSHSFSQALPLPFLIDSLGQEYVHMLVFTRQK